MSVRKPGDRRRFKRLVRAIPCWYRLEPGEQLRRCHAIDFCPGGALLDLGEYLRPGTEFELHFDLTTNCQVETEAKVVRNRSAFWGRRRLIAVTYRPVHRADRAWVPVWHRQQVRASRILSAPTGRTHFS